MGRPAYLVNTATLGLVIEDILYAHAGLGPPVVFRLTYNAADGRRGLFGRGWRLSCESSIVVSGGRIFLSRGSGQVLAFQPGRPPGPGQPYPVEALPPEGVFDRLVEHSEQWVLVEKDTRWLYMYQRLPGQPQARLVRVADQAGNTVQMEYAAGGALAALTDSAGRVFRLEHDEHGRCTRLALPDGRAAHFRYDGRGCLSGVTDLAGIEIAYAYDDQDRLERMSIDRGRLQTAFTYQPGQNSFALASLTQPDGGVKRYEFLPGLPGRTRITDPGGRASEYEARDGLTLREVDPAGGALQNTFERCLLVRHKNRRGGETRFTYDTHGNLMELALPGGESWSYVWGPGNLLVSASDALGNTWRFQGTPAGQPLRIEDPAGHVYVFEYTGRGQLQALIDPADGRTSFAYDDVGSLAAWTDPLGRCWKLGYRPGGLQLATITDPAGGMAQVEYDGNDRLTRLVFADGAERRYAYDCCSGVSVTDENDAVLRYKHDALLRMVEQANALGQRTLYEYDPSGRLLRRTSPSGAAVRFSYDDKTRRLTRTDPAGSMLQFEADEHDNLRTLVNENGARTAYAYDALDRLASVTDAAGQQRRIVRDRAGRIKRLENARGQTVEFIRNPDGSLAGQRSSLGEDIHCTYDAGGWLSSVQNAGGLLRFSRDAAGQVTQIDYPDGLTLRLEYSLLGFAQRLCYPDGFEVTCEYDARSRPVRVLWGEHWLAARCDAAGRLLQLERSNGLTTTWEYDAAGQLAALRHAGRAALADLRFEWDADGHLCTATGTLPFDGAPLEAPLSVTCGPDNQLLTCNGVPCQVDDDGNLASIGSAWVAAYDPLNQPLELRRDGQLRRYTYDLSGRRVTCQDERGVWTFHYDPWDRLLFVTGPDGRVSERYIYLGGRLAAVDRPGSGSCFYHFDERGSTLALTNAAGEQVEAYVYTPYGAYVARTGAAPWNRFIYIGEFGVQDDGGGLYWMRRRWYDSLLGRFLQRDPIGLRGGANLYAYTAGDPVTWIDPVGTVATVVVAGITLLGLAAAGYGMWWVSNAITARQAEKQAAADALAEQTELKNFKGQAHDDRIMRQAERNVTDLRGYGAGGQEAAAAVEATVETGAAAAEAINPSRPAVAVGEHLIEEGVRRASQRNTASGTPQLAPQQPCRRPAGPAGGARPAAGGRSSGGGGASW